MKRIVTQARHQPAALQLNDVIQFCRFLFETAAKAEMSSLELDRWA
ncbi:hypothetical protein [Acidocella sp.]